MNNISTLRTGLVALALIGTLSACALGKMGYQNGDTVGMLWMNRYLDLTGEQKDFVKPRLRQLLTWHRKTQLTHYATAAADLRKKADGPIAPADVEAVDRQFRTHANALVQHMLPELADVALQLTPDNIRAMESKFAENDKKFRDDNEMDDSVEDQQKARYEKSLERFEDWYGRLDREQRAQVRKLSDARPLNNRLLLEERQRRQQEFIATLTKIEREKPSRDQAIAQLKTYASRFERSPNADRRAFQDAYRKTNDEMNAGVHNLTTPEQRAKAAEKLQKWVDDFNELAAGA